MYKRQKGHLKVKTTDTPSRFIAINFFISSENPTPGKMFRPPNIHRRKNNLFILNTTLVSKDATLPTKPTKSRVSWITLKNVYSTTELTWLIFFIFVSFSVFYPNFVHELRSMASHIWAIERDISSKGNRFQISFHSVNFLSHLVSRLWWTIAIVSAIILCTFWIYSSWGSNQENSVILRYDRAHQSVKKLPFPAITICPKVKTSVEKFNYTDVYRSLLDLDGNRSRQVTSKELIHIVLPRKWNKIVNWIHFLGLFVWRQLINCVKKAKHKKTFPIYIRTNSSMVHCWSF